MPGNALLSRWTPISLMLALVIGLFAQSALPVASRLVLTAVCAVAILVPLRVYPSLMRQVESAEPGLLAEQRLEGAWNWMNGYRLAWVSFDRRMRTHPELRSRLRVHGANCAISIAAIFAAVYALVL